MNSGERAGSGIAKVANKRDKKDVDVEVDLHGLTAEQMRLTLQKRWPEWRGMRRVRIVHGRGEVLKPSLERWCEEMGIPYASDAGNPGSMRLFPSQRTIPDNPLNSTLRDKGLSLTPEQEAYLRDPQAAERERQAALKRQQEEERRKADEAARSAAQRRREEALWQAELARLDALDRSRRGGSETDSKLRPPRILPPSEIKHHEGYWRAELVRVADTDTDTLKKQKRTGLDKLAPPMEAKPAPQPTDPQAKTPLRPAAETRDTEADRALFEAEMARLEEFDPGTTRRAKRG